MSARTRNQGIEILRVVSMAAIIMIHINWQGGFINGTEPGSAQYYLGWLVEAAVYPSVDAFCLISGYVGLGTSHRLSSIVNLCLITVFFGTGIAAGALVMGAHLGWYEIARSVFPPFFGRFWYLAAYLCVYPFMPLLDRVVNELLDEHSARRLMGALMVVSCLIPTVTFSDFATTSRGYSAIWLGILYLMGACLRRFGWMGTLSIPRSLVLFVACVALSFGSKIFYDDLFLTRLHDNWVRTSMQLIQYDAPFTLGAAIALLSLFSKITIPARFHKAIAFWASSAFSVYIIHSSPLVYDKLIAHRFVWVGHVHALAVIPVCLAISAGVYVACTLADKVRAKLFELVGVKRLLAAVDERYQPIR